MKLVKIFVCIVVVAIALPFIAACLTYVAACFVIIAVLHIGSKLFKRFKNENAAS